MIEREVVLHLDDPNVRVRIPVSQFDTMWRFTFTVLCQGQPWEIPIGAIAVLNGRKPDGNVFAFGGTVTDNKVTVDCDVQMTAVAGAVVCKLSILSDGKVVGTANFILDVEAVPKSPDDISSESTLPAYGEILDRIADLEHGGGITIDTELSETSENAVQNRVVKAALNGKVNAVQGKGLSTNDYTTEDKQKLDAINDSHNWKIGSAISILGVNTVSLLDPITGITRFIPYLNTANNRFTLDPPALPVATQTERGAMSAADKVKLDHLESDLAVKADKITEVTVATDGAVTQALDAGKWYHFTGDLTSLTVTLMAAGDDLAQYHFDFTTGATAPTVTLPDSVVMQDSFSVEANKRYEVDILNNYGAVMAWAIS